MNRTFSISVAAGLLAVLAGSMMTFTVPDDRQVVVTTFGSVSKVYDGRSEAGLKFKAPWPIQGYRSYPAGLRVTATQPTDVTIDACQSDADCAAYGCVKISFGSGEVASFAKAEIVSAIRAASRDE